MIILNLSGGLQSTTIYRMAELGELPATIDIALWADTGEEPAWTYRVMDGLMSKGKILIHVVSAGRIGDDLVVAGNQHGVRQRFASIPAFVKEPGKRRGVLRRQCSHQYKVRPIELHIKRKLFGLSTGQRMKTTVTQVYGISRDEQNRVKGIINRSPKWSKPWFPLIELGFSRSDCEEWLRSRGFNVPKKSACVICPYRSNSEWADLIRWDREGWERAVNVDENLRGPVVAARGLRGKMYLHESCRPLGELKGLLEISHTPCKIG